MSVPPGNCDHFFKKLRSEMPNGARGFQENRDKSCGAFYIIVVILLQREVKTAILNIELLVKKKLL